MTLEAVTTLRTTSSHRTRRHAIDAPGTSPRGRQSVKWFPLTNLVGPSRSSSTPPRPTREMPTIRSASRTFNAESSSTGPSPPTRFSLLRTGFARHWPDAARYLGTSEQGEAAVAKLHFPELTSRRREMAPPPTEGLIKAIGIDTASIDFENRRCTSPIARCSSATSRRSRTSRRSIGCRRREPRRSAADEDQGSGGALRVIAILGPTRTRFARGSRSLRFARSCGVGGCAAS